MSLERPRPIEVYAQTCVVAHSSFIEGSHTTKNTASGLSLSIDFLNLSDKLQTTHIGFHFKGRLLALQQMLN